MDQRKQIGFYYYFDKSWLGGLYYAQNLIIALNTLDDDKKPVINVYCYNDDSFNELKAKTGYPYLKMSIIHISKYKNILRMLLLPISRRLAANIDLFKISPDDSMIFPYGWGKYTDKLVYWMPDFQHRHYPQYFSKKELLKRDFAIKSVCERGIPIVFSSYDSQKDYRKYYPEYVDHKTYVVHFAVNEPDYSDVSLEQVKDKYGIKGNYLMCSNQFWRHKNHLFLFKSFKKAIDKGLNLQLVCTGRLSDDRCPDYINSIKEYISSNGLSEKIKLLGIIDRKEMLCLMQNSYAVVQPSLFEGWNTTVEDCKKMNKFIYLSDLNVHKEQISENVCFFIPNNEDDLADKLINVTPTKNFYDYNKNIEAFANDFYYVIKKFIK